MRLETILAILAWLFILTGWLWIGVSVVMVVGAAWGAGKRRTPWLFRARDSRTELERISPAEPNGNTCQKINPGQAPPPACSGTKKESRSRRVGGWICAHCRQQRYRSGVQRCNRCGRVTRTVWHRIDSWSCIRCGRETPMTDPFCGRCRDQTGAERTRQRADQQKGQLRLW